MAGKRLEVGKSVYWLLRAVEELKGSRAVVLRSVLGQVRESRKNYECLGKLKTQSYRLLYYLMHYLEREGWIEVEHDGRLYLSAKAKEWLSAYPQGFEVEEEALYHLTFPFPLYMRLVELCKELEERIGIPFRRRLGEHFLERLAQAQPTTLRQLYGMEAIPRGVPERFWLEVVRVIRQWKLERQARQLHQKVRSSVIEQLCALVQQGVEYKVIAKEMRRRTTTILYWIELLYLEGLVDLGTWLEQQGGKERLMPVIRYFQWAEHKAMRLAKRLFRKWREEELFLARLWSYVA